MKEQGEREQLDRCPHIGPVEFFVRARLLESKIRLADGPPFQALFGVKRSGWVLGAFISHALGLPLFAKVEVASIPAKFKRILIVDTICWTGKTLRKERSALIRAAKSDITAAVIFAHRDRNVPDEFHLIIGDEASEIPRFFFQRKFRYTLSRDDEYRAEAIKLGSEPLGDYYPGMPSTPGQGAQ